MCMLMYMCVWAFACVPYSVCMCVSTSVGLFVSVAKLLWTKVFNQSSNNSGLQSMSFYHQRNALITPEIPMMLVDIHDVAFVSLKDTCIFK